jgi:hypothetical protein
MKLSKLAAAAVALTMTVGAGSAQAIVCMAPTPVCGVVIIGGIVAAVLGNNKKAAKGEVNKTLAASDHAKLVSVVRRIDGTSYSLRMVKYANYSGGYHDVISRYNNGRISGRLSLESLAENSPKLFADLDKLEQLMTAAYTAEVTAHVYGPKLKADGSVNWLRYKTLALDALAINKGQFDN